MTHGGGIKFLHSLHFLCIFVISNTFWFLLYSHVLIASAVQLPVLCLSAPQIVPAPRAKKVGFVDQNSHPSFQLVLGNRNVVWSAAVSTAYVGWMKLSEDFVQS